ncbi:hypothetical protein KUTeg_009548 [Tegillarca granosa]|uniref:Peptidase metallopeptidase domain-containing protein n=1 Tax=Tegillarca granosa TaxID=220873 RepID=A0ABQ9F7D8_TEGGR|nr:hypothetical protein KUTeg_009548 [Tegillarca granosa]
METTEYKALNSRILNYTPDLDIEKVRKAIYEAFKVWSDATDLTFTETTASYADIMIKFASGYHQDGYPFDGKGLILAHAFFPGEDKGGDTHFDDDEKWILNSKEDGVDLFMVAAHEFGHALGLGHSSEPKALMYPWYQGFDENFKLPYDDIQGIQRLYGGRGPLPRPPTDRPRLRTTTRAPKVVTNNPRYEPTGSPNKPPTINPCEHRFDAISVLRREVFLFMGDTFYRLDSRGLIQGEPTKIHSFWYGLPKRVNKIDAVFERITDGKIIIFIGKTYFFKGEYYYEFYDNYMKVRKGFPKLIRKHWLGCNAESQEKYNSYTFHKPALYNSEKNNIENGVSDIKAGILTLCVLSFMTSLFYVLQ